MNNKSTNGSTLDRKITEYLRYLENQKHSSPLTLRNYDHYLSRFNSFLKERKRAELSRIDRKIVEIFERYLERGLGLGKRTVSYHVIALRSFLKWASQRGMDVPSADLIKPPKAKAKKPETLTGRQVDSLLNAPSLSNINGLRDKAILELIFSTGLRVSDLVGINRHNVNYARREIIIGANGTKRVVEFSARAGGWLQRYLKARKDNTTPLFVRHKGGKLEGNEDARLTARSVQRMVKKYAKKMDLPDFVTPHTLRHSMAVNLLNTGAETAMVQKILGHKNLETTEQIYG